MVQLSDFTPVCNRNVTRDFICTPQTCCLDQAQVNYIPSLTGNIFFAASIGIFIIPNAIFGIKYKTWSFFTWMTLGLIGEVVGYAGRIMLYNNVFSFDAFLTYLIPLTIAPAFITASIYLCLARIVHILDPALRHTRLQPITYTKIFVTFDVVSLVLQGAGGGVAATANDKPTSDMGVDIMIAGLAFQVFSLVCFIAICADFAARLHKGKTSPTSSEMKPNAEILDYDTIKGSRMFKGFVGGLGAAVLLILTRSVYRLIELQEGFNGKLANDEHLFFGLEGPMVLLASLLLTTFHPGLALKGIWSMREFRGRMSREEEKSVVLDSREGSQVELASAVRGAPYEVARG